jgi:YD repeat-containing protein
MISFIIFFLSLVLVGLTNPLPTTEYSSLPFAPDGLIVAICDDVTGHVNCFNHETGAVYGPTSDVAIYQANPGVGPKLDSDKSPSTPMLAKRHDWFLECDGDREHWSFCVSSPRKFYCDAQGQKHWSWWHEGCNEFCQCRELSQVRNCEMRFRGCFQWGSPMASESTDAIATTADTSGTAAPIASGNTLVNRAVAIDVQNLPGPPDGFEVPICENPTDHVDCAQIATGIIYGSEGTPIYLANLGMIQTASSQSMTKTLFKRHDYYMDCDGDVVRTRHCSGGPHRYYCDGAGKIQSQGWDPQCDFVCKCYKLGGMRKCRGQIHDCLFWGSPVAEEVDAGPATGQADAATSTDLAPRSPSTDLANLPWVADGIILSICNGDALVNCFEPDTGAIYGDVAGEATLRAKPGIPSNLDKRGHDWYLDCDGDSANTRHCVSPPRLFYCDANGNRRSSAWDPSCDMVCRCHKLGVMRGCEFKYRGCYQWGSPVAEEVSDTEPAAATETPASKLESRASITELLAAPEGMQPTVCSESTGYTNCFNADTGKVYGSLTDAPICLIQPGFLAPEPKDPLGNRASTIGLANLPDAPDGMKVTVCTDYTGHVDCFDSSTGLVFGSVAEQAMYRVNPGIVANSTGPTPPATSKDEEWILHCGTDQMKRTCTGNWYRYYCTTYGPPKHHGHAAYICEVHCVCYRNAYHPIPPTCILTREGCIGPWAAEASEEVSEAACSTEDTPAQCQKKKSTAKLAASTTSTFVA